ncbi:globin C, coelomic-like isoform X1 [Ruditapes philippinarum]|uniref:globin C, coelomic-like isoform X1 n=1 Tax=Ruditapes philippinarum TaxID=129788 RepID=UPI00295B73C4|nr:globin C, coelomic-like isoform X1 [Ruditapes philippinarum]
MGCLYSTKRKDAMRKNKNVNTQPRKKYLPDKTGDENDNGNNIEKNLPDFTDEQKELVIESWKEIKDDMDKVGIQMFMKLFASHPDVQDAFTTFKGMSPEDLTHSNQLRSHAMRVMGTVDKCLTCIHEPDIMFKTLHDLGARHVMYTAKVDYMDLIGPQFILAIQPVIGEKWNSELEQAWSDLFKLIAHVMKAAMTFY